MSLLLIRITFDADADPGANPAGHFVADPDPTLHFDADPYPLASK